MKSESSSPARKSPVAVLLTSLLMLLAFTGPSFSQNDEAKDKPDDEAPAVDEELFQWSTRSYRIPGSVLSTGFVSEKRGQLNLPEMPAEDAKPEEIQEFIRDSSEVLTLFFSENNIIVPPGMLAVADVAHDVVAVRATGEVHGRIELLVKELAKYQSRILAFRSDMLEADKTEALNVLQEAMGQSDHTEQLEYLEALIAEGKARILDSGRIDTKPGLTVEIESGTEKESSTDIRLNGNGSSGKVSQESRNVGMKVAISAVVGSDLELIDLEYMVEYHLTPPTKRQLPVGSMDGKRVEAPVTDFRIARLHTNISILDGQSRLMGVWQAPGEENQDKLVLNFLTSRAVLVQPNESLVVLNWLNDQGEQVTPTPPAVKPGPGADPEAGMIVRKFRIRASFLEGGSRSNSPIDPFGPPASEPTFQVRATALDILRAKGIPFPDGSSANYLPSSGEIIVRNLPDNMKLVEQFFRNLEADTYASPQMAFHLHIIEADGPWFRKQDRAMMGIADHTQFWEEVQKEIAAGRADLLRTARIETKPGLTAETSDSIEYMTVTDAGIDDGDLTVKNGVVEGGLQSIQPEFQRVRVGLNWDITPVLGADNATIDLEVAVSYHTAPPTERFDPPVRDQIWRFDAPEVDFHKGLARSNLSLRSGMMRMVGAWKPKGTPELEGKDIIQAAFLKAVVIKVAP